MNSRKFTLIVVGLLIVISVLVGVIVLVISQNSNPGKTTNSTSSTLPAATTSSLSSSSSDANVIWQFDFENKTWLVSGNPPACPEPLVIKSPARFDIATGVLYPGQVRGGDYKPHGGIRYDGVANTEIVVSLPMDAKLVSASRYIEAGEVQYLLDFLNPCGLMFRFDHLLTLAPAFQEIIDAFVPAPKVDDSRTTNISLDRDFAEGEIVATAAGHTGNTAFDFGVYDLRRRNAISSDPNWQALHMDEASQAFYALCWFNLLPSADKAIALSLPGGGTEGKVSDYCK